MKIELTPKANEIISKVKSELIGNGKQSVAYVSGMQFALTNPELILAQSKHFFIGFANWISDNYMPNGREGCWDSKELNSNGESKYLIDSTEQLLNIYLAEFLN